jgi:uncharacterized membrane protein
LRNRARDFLTYRPPGSKRGTITLIITGIIILFLGIYGYRRTGSDSINMPDDLLVVMAIVLILVIGFLLYFIFTIKDNPDYFSVKGNKISFIIHSVTGIIIAFVIICFLPSLFRV